MHVNRYPAWKNALIISLVLLGALFASPNLFGDDPAVQVSHATLVGDPSGLQRRVEAALAARGIAHHPAELREGRLQVRFDGTEVQLRAADVLRAELQDPNAVALFLAPRTPDWMRSLGLRPMNLGLDLRGGVHFLLQVDMDAALGQTLERYETDARTLLRSKDINYLVVARDGATVLARFREPTDRDAARTALAGEYPELTLTDVEGAEGAALRLAPSEVRMREIRDAAVQQNITTLRNRVNEIGVAEPIVQRQGADRIVVQLPGIQDPAAAKKILGATATLEFRMVAGPDETSAKMFRERDGNPVALKREVIARGDQVADAQATIDVDTGGPAVSISLDSVGGRRMGATTAANVGKPMAVVFIENLPTTRIAADGSKLTERRRVETVINVATIRSPFSSRFQVTGLEQEEARQLALNLRAGSLAAPVDIVEERTIGPSLGADNIEVGLRSALLGFGLVVLVIGIYYGVFGWLANIAMVFNVMMLIALLSLLQATLTLPGIAGIVLTVGMAVDANVLIYERIREELKRGQTPQAAIHAGFERAFATITDSNITTLIAALVLFGLGSGPVKGFAITLSLGIVTSVFSSINVSRMMINAIYGGRRVERLSV